MLLTFTMAIILTSCEKDKYNASDLDQVKDYSEIPIIESQIKSQANSVIFYEVKGLSKASDVILIGTAEKTFEEREHVVTYYDDGDIEDYYTKTEVKINDLLKNKNNIHTGETIQVNEPISVIKQENELYKIRYNNYGEIRDGVRYIFFLKRNPEGSYSIIGENYGKFEVNQSDKNDKNSKYEKLKSEVFDMYDIKR